MLSYETKLRHLDTQSLHLNACVQQNNWTWLGKLGWRISEKVNKNARESSELKDEDGKMRLEYN